jgi:hypothetical protein
MDLYRAMYLDVQPAGDNVLLHYPDRREPVLLPAFDFELLADCTYFASVEEHAAAAGRRTGLPADGIAQTLYELVDRGLLSTEQEIIDRARSTVESNVDATLTPRRVSVITSDRPEKLAGCLRSFREQYGSEIELAVFDDSTDPSGVAANRRVVAEAGAGGPTTYAGFAEKKRFVDSLADRSGVDAAIVGAALTEFDGFTFHCGANRNAVLLDAAGDAVILVDDDTTVRAAQPADAAEGMRLSSQYDAWSLRFFRDLNDAVNAATWQDVDLVSWHSRFLGRSLAAAVCGRAFDEGSSNRDADPDMNDADVALIKAFANGRGRVIATAAGVVGDSGMGSPVYLLTLQGQPRESLLEDYESYRATRAVHRGAPTITFSNSDLFMGAHVALDVRGLIPPFPPVLRNSDGVFGSLLKTCFPEFCIAFLPWQVEHAPPEIRRLSFSDSVRSVAQVRANDLLIAIARLSDPAPGVSDSSIRLPALGRYLVGLGSSDARDFDTFIRQQIAGTIGRRIERLTRAVNSHGGEPSQWADDCATVIAEAERALTDDDLTVADVPAATPGESYRRFQRLVGRFGEVIEAWPTLLRESANLRVATPLA